MIKSSVLFDVGLAYSSAGWPARAEGLLVTRNLGSTMAYTSAVHPIHMLILSEVVFAVFATGHVVSGLFFSNSIAMSQQ